MSSGTHEEAKELFKKGGEGITKCHKILTCCGDPREDPALAVAHGNAVAGVVLLQDVNTAAPRSGRDAIGVVARPVSHQDAEVILGVDLGRPSG